MVVIIFAVVIVALVLLFISLNKPSPSMTPKTGSQSPPSNIPSCFSQGPSISISSGATYECVLANMPTGNCGVDITLNLTSSMPINAEIADEYDYILYQWSGTTYINQVIKLVNPSSYNDSLYLIIHNPNNRTANVYLSYTEYRGCDG